MDPNITFQTILEYPDKPWSWEAFSRNTFNFDKKQEKLKNDAARLIQRKMMDWLYKPYCKDKSIGLMVARGMRECGIEVE
jgi:hypothetical protein